jgi:hypothetical protein
MKLLSVFGAIMKMVRLGLRWWIVRQAKRQLAVVKDGIEPCRLNVERHSDRREKPVSQMVHRIDIPEGAYHLDCAVGWRRQWRFAPGESAALSHSRGGI